MYEKAVIARNYVSKTEFEKMNTKGCAGKGRGKLSECRVKVSENYIRQQRGKAGHIKALMDINFERNRSCFTTLTFSEEPADIDAVYRAFALFRRRLGKKYNALRYVAVIERGDLQRWHIHIILNMICNADNTANIIACWNKGVDVDVRNVFDVQGLAVYMTKDFGRYEEKLYARKRYLVSKGLEQPVEINNWGDRELYNQTIACSGRFPGTVKKVIQNKYAGKVVYSTYKCDTGVFGDYITAEVKGLI